MLNPRHAIAKEKGWKEHPPTKRELIDAALQDNNLLRRPIVIRGPRVLIGGDEAALRKILGKGSP